MAIKGKGKTRGRKGIAASPRPVVAIRKPPIYKRAWVWILVGAVFLGVVAFVVLRTVSAASDRRMVAQEKVAVGKFSTLVTVQLPADQTQALGSDLQLYPTLSSDLDKLDKGGVSADVAERTAKAFADGAKKAADAIEGIKVFSLINERFDVGEGPAKAPGLTQLTLVSSQYLMTQAFRTYQSAFDLWAQAARATGEERTALITEAKTLAIQGQDLFNSGYRKLNQVRFALGLVQPQLPQPIQPGQLPPTTAPPASPSQAPSPKASPKSPKPKASSSGT